MFGAGARALSAQRGRPMARGRGLLTARLVTVAVTVVVVVATVGLWLAIGSSR